MHVILLTHHRLGKSLENPSQTFYVKFCLPFRCKRWPGGGSLRILLLLVLDCSCELLRDVCGDCTHSLLETVKGVKRAGGVWDKMEMQTHSVCGAEQGGDGSW